MHLSYKNIKRQFIVTYKTPRWHTLFWPTLYRADILQTSVQPSQTYLSSEYAYECTYWHVHQDHPCYIKSQRCTDVEQLKQLNCLMLTMSTPQSARKNNWRV